MKLFLTCKINPKITVDGIYMPTPIFEDNNLHKMLSHAWPLPARVLIFAADPDAVEINDSVRRTLEHSFALSGLDTDRVHLCDGRNPEIAGCTSDYNVVILAGGHVPTQNRFFHCIGLKERLQNFDGMIIGLSAGTMNCAGLVYAAPEEDGESIDSDYQRFIPGLGLTDLNIFPHYQKIKDAFLDGKRVMEDITYPDSIGHTFYALTDGSFVYQEDDVQTVYGECYRIQDGGITKICEERQQLVLTK